MYAAANDLLIGSGFDFDIYAWDPVTALLQLTLTGHSCALINIAAVHIPMERIISCDEGGALKVWNIDRGLGNLAGMKNFAFKSLCS